MLGAGALTGGLSRAVAMILRQLALWGTKRQGRLEGSSRVVWEEAVEN